MNITEKIYLDTTIEKLYYLTAFNKTTLSFMRACKLTDVQSIINRFGSAAATGHIFGLPSLSVQEVIEVINNTVQENSPQEERLDAENYKLSNELYSLGKAANVIFEAYESITPPEGHFTKLIKEKFPYAWNLNHAVINSLSSLLEIDEDLTPEEILQLRSLYYKYIRKVVEDSSKEPTFTASMKQVYYRAAKDFAPFVLDKSDDKSDEKNKDESPYLIPQLVYTYADAQYKDAIEKEIPNKNTRQYISRKFPQFIELVLAVKSSFARFKHLYLKGNNETLLREVFLFGKRFASEYKAIRQMDDNEITLRLINKDYPFLTGEEVAAIVDFQIENGYMPLFYILKAFKKVYPSINVGQAQKYRAKILSNTDWDKYEEIFGLKLITSETPAYKEIKRNENIKINLQEFSRLLNTAKYKYRIRTCNNKSMIFTDDAFGMIKFDDHLEKIKQLKNQIFEKETYLPIDSLIGNVPEDLKPVAKDMLRYIGKEMFGLQLRDNDTFYFKPGPVVPSLQNSEHERTGFRLILESRNLMQLPANYPFYKLQMTSQEYELLQLLLKNAAKEGNLDSYGLEAAAFFAEWWKRDYKGGLPTIENVAASLEITEKTLAEQLFKSAKKALVKLNYDDFLKEDTEKGYFRKLLFLGGIPSAFINNNDKAMKSMLTFVKLYLFGQYG